MSTDRNETYAQRFFDAAIEHFEKGQFSKSIENIKKAIEKAPRNADFLATKGILFHRMKELNFAISAYQEAIRVSPSHLQSHFNLGIILYQVGNRNEAISEWETVLKTDPNDFEAQFNIAVAAAQSGEIEKAIGLFEKVLRIKSDHVQSHHNLGVLYRNKRWFEQSKKHMEMLKTLDSTFLEVVNSEILKMNQMEFLEKNKQDDKINEVIAELPKSKTRSINDKISDALIALLKADFGKALKISDEILEDIPGDFQTRLIRAQALLGGGRADDSITEFIQLAEEKPNSADIHFQLANAYLEKDDFGKALEQFEQILIYDRHYPLVEENIAAIHEQLKT
ncbi:MAG: tetratricopeptide repeat protein [Candidatus Riflebacteria bacterium]|nr:tetratricopeptide repeat protein [Candidatus Riflebacteria bacterium]